MLEKVLFSRIFKFTKLIQYKSETTMPILPMLLLLFFSVPLLEIFLLLQVGSEIGVLWTVFFVIFTAVLGSILIRIQGFSLLMQSRRQLSAGQLPTDAVFSGACLLVAGALLLTPGFFTDFIGFLLLTPMLRNIAYRYFVNKLQTKATEQFQQAHQQTAQRPRQSRDGIIEGEFSQVNENDKNRKNLP